MTYIDCFINHKHDDDTVCISKCMPRVNYMFGLQQLDQHGVLLYSQRSQQQVCWFVFGPFAHQVGVPVSLFLVRLLHAPVTIDC